MKGSYELIKKQVSNISHHKTKQSLDGSNKCNMLTKHSNGWDGVKTSNENFTESLFTSQCNFLKVSKKRKFLHIFL